MPKINEQLTSTSYFEVDDVPKMKGEYDLDINTTNNTVGIFRIAKNQASTYLVEPTLYSDYTNSSDEDYASLDSLVTDLKNTIYPPSSGASDSTNVNSSGTNT